MDFCRNAFEANMAGHECEPPAVRRYVFHLSFAPQIMHQVLRQKPVRVVVPPWLMRHVGDVCSCLPELLPKHTIFLSHSGEEKDFVEQLCEDLKRMNYCPFFDQEAYSLPKGEKFASLIFQAAEECWLAVVVVSKGYLTSKWPMLELSAFVKARKTKNPKLKLMPVFYKSRPGDLSAEKVETEWMKSWNGLVEKGEVRVEEVALWREGVRELRGSNGVDYSKYGTSEVKFRAAVVEEIFKCVPPVMKYNTDRVLGYERMCKMLSSMFEEGTRDGDICKPGRLYLGLYGMGGLGKTTLCGAMCSYLQAEFRGRVCHVEIQGDEESKRVERLRHAIRQLSGLDSRIVETITSESQGLECLVTRLREQPAVFIAVDNVGDSWRSQEEARAYLNVGVACGSKVMVTCRSGMILKSILGDGKYCKAIPRLEVLEAKELFLSFAAPTKGQCTLQLAEDEIVKAYLRECQFAEDGCSREEYHPLVLRALGIYCHDVDEDDIMSWKVGLDEGGVLQKSRELEGVNAILGLNYYKLPEIQKCIFLDVALLLSVDFVLLKSMAALSGMGERMTSLHTEYGFLAQLYDTTQSDVKMKVKELQRKSLINETGSTLSMHDLYSEFAQMLVRKEGSSERKWWFHSDDGDVVGLKRLVYSDVVWRNPEQILEYVGLECLALVDCDFPENFSFDLASLRNLRVLLVVKCNGIEEIVCNCGKGSNGLLCYERKGGDERCLPQLRIVSVYQDNSDIDNVDMIVRCPFLRHCSRLRWLGKMPIARKYFLEDMEALKNMKSLEVLHIGFVVEVDVDDDYGEENFFGELLSGVTVLKNLKIVSLDFGNIGYFGLGEFATIDLSSLGALIHLFDLAITNLPHIMELKGLEQLSKLRILSLTGCTGLIEVKGLDQLSQLSILNLEACEELCKLPKLPSSVTHFCFHHCLKVEVPIFPSGVKELRSIQPEDEIYYLTNNFNSSIMHKEFHWDCLSQHCNRCICLDCMLS